MSNVKIINWTHERETLRTFLSSGDGVAHVRGAAKSHWRHFAHVIREELAAATPDGTLILIDPYDMSTSTPLGCLRFIAQKLGVDDLDMHSLPFGDILSHIRARRDVTISGVQIVNYFTRSDSEEFDQLKRTLAKLADGTANFDGIAVAFLDVHLMDETDRRYYMSSIWNPLIQNMCQKGLKAFFMYTKDELVLDSGTIPPEADHLINLPTAIGGDHVAGDIVQLVLEEDWKGSEPEAMAVAEALMSVSDSTSDLYANLAKFGRSR